MLSEALSAPMRSDDTAGTLLVGSVLLLFSVLFPLLWGVALTVSPVWVVLAPLAIFPPLLTLGYDLRVMEAGLRGERPTPSFLHWADLVRDGLRSIVLGVVPLIPAVVVFAGAGAIVAALQTGALGVSERVATVATGLVFLGAGGFVSLYVVLFLYVRPAILAVFVSTGRIREALSPQRVSRVALSSEYAIGWIVAGGVLLVGWMIAVPLQLLLVGFAIAFYARAVAYHRYGSGAREQIETLSDSRWMTETAIETEPEAEREPNTETEDTHGSPVLSWSPRLGAEPPAAVQVGRSVALPTDSHDGARTGEDEHRLDSAIEGRFEWEERTE